MFYERDNVWKTSNGSKKDVNYINEPLSLDDILALEKYGFPGEENRHLREKAEEIHREVLMNLYGWNGNYEELKKKIRYGKSDAWFLTTIVQEKIEPEEIDNLWKKQVYSLLSLAYYATDWKEIPKGEWKKYKREAEMNRINWVMPNFNSLNYVIIGSAGIVQCIFGKSNITSFENFGIFHPLQRMVEIWVHQDAICRTFEIIGRSKNEEIYKTRADARKEILNNLVAIKLQAETTLDRFFRISDYFKRIESTELSEIVQKKWGINELFKSLKDRLDALAELGLTLNSLSQAKIFGKISILIAIFGLAGIPSSFSYWIISGEVPLEKIGFLFILTFLPVFFAIAVMLFITKESKLQ